MPVIKPRRGGAGRHGAGRAPMAAQPPRAGANGGAPGLRAPPCCRARGGRCRLAPGGAELEPGAAPEAQRRSRGCPARASTAEERLVSLPLTGRCPPRQLKAVRESQNRRDLWRSPIQPCMLKPVPYSRSRRKAPRRISNISRGGHHNLSGQPDPML